MISILMCMLSMNTPMITIFNVCNFNRLTVIYMNFTKPMKFHALKFRIKLPLCWTGILHI